MRVRFKEDQLLEIKKIPGRMRIFNNGGKMNDNDLTLIKEYPHYFIDFIYQNDIEELEESDEISSLFKLSKEIRNSIDDNEKLELKKQLTNLLLNNELYNMFLHRFAEDFLAPLKKKQDYTDKMKQRRYKDITDDEHRTMGTVNIYKNPSINSTYPKESDYKDFLIS